MVPESPRFRDILRRSHFPALDGLRAIAVFTVILGHRNYPIPGVPADLGVDAFFVLSGFLITRLLMRELAATGRVSLRKFYARRTMRIFPAYYAFLLLNFALDTMRGEHWGTALGWSAMTYTVNYYNAFHHHPPTSIAHAWSLGIEEQFYLLWPLAFLVLARRGVRTAVTGVGVMACMALAWRSFLTARGVDVAYLYNAFDTRLDNLAIGCILALVADLPRVGAAAEQLARRAWYPVVTLLALLALRTGVSDEVHYSIGFTLYAILVAVLIAQLMQLTVTPMWSWLEHPVTRYLGLISYPLYLYHGLGAAIARHASSRRPVEFVVSVLATILLATGSYYVIERPFLKLKKRFATPRTGAAPSVAGGTLPAGPSSAHERAGVSMR